MNEKLTITDEKKLICPECDETMELLLQRVTNKITVLKADTQTKAWDTAHPVKEYDDEVNPNYTIICSKCGFEFRTTEEPFMTSDEFDELEEKILNGKLTQMELAEVA